MNNIFNFVNPRYELKTTKKKEKKEYGIDINALVVDDDGSSPLNQPIMEETPKAKRTSRKKELVVNATPVNDNPNLMQTNTPYLNTYNETAHILFNKTKLGFIVASPISSLIKADFPNDPL